MLAGLSVPENRTGGITMETVQANSLPNSESHDVSRRTAIGRLVISGVGVALLARDHRLAQAQDTTPEPGQCVATAPPLDASGIAFVPLGQWPRARHACRPHRCAHLPAGDGARRSHRGLCRAASGPDVHLLPVRPPALAKRAGSSMRRTAHWSRNRMRRTCSTRRPGRCNTSPPAYRTAPAMRAPN